MKIIALVLTCSKPEYVARREENKETYEFLEKNGILVLFCLADLTSPFPYVKGNTLYVPVSEDYENIPLRMWMAYNFLSNFNEGCILKMDDDIKIVNKDLFIAGLSEIIKYNYSSIMGVGGREIGEKDGIIVANTYHWKKCKNENLNKTYAIFPSVEYASGPCYCISMDTARRLKKSDFEKCIFEDACLGIACKKYRIPLFEGDQLMARSIKGDMTPWPYTQYLLKNYSMYNDLIYT